jgi:hypothetical protein
VNLLLHPHGITRAAVFSVRERRRERDPQHATVFARSAAMTRRRIGLFRSAWTKVRGREHDGPDDELGTLWTGSNDAPRRETPAMRAGRARAEAVDRDLELVQALTRVADTFSRIADGLDSDRRERRAQFEADRHDRRTQLDAVEYLLREMTVGIGGATSVPPVVVGGSIDPASLAPGSIDTGLGRRALDGLDEVEVDLTDDVTDDLTELPIELDAPVEVRSRFHDGWVSGFMVADYVRGPDGNGYRLRREAEDEPLPMRYDPADVRRAGATNELPPPLPRRSFSDG